MAHIAQVSEEDKDRIITMLSNQYMSLRIEINEHLRGMYVLCAAIGTATMAAFSVGFYLMNNTVTATSIFNVAIPALLIAGTLGILTAISEAIRISQYIVNEIEDPIHLILGKQHRSLLEIKDQDSNLVKKSGKIMGWESSLFSIRRNRMVHNVTRQNIFIVGGLFVLVYVVSVSIGEILVFSSSLWADMNLIIRIILGVVPFILLLFAVVATNFLFRAMTKIELKN